MKSVSTFRKSFFIPSYSCQPELNKKAKICTPCINRRPLHFRIGKLCMLYLTECTPPKSKYSQLAKKFQIHIVRFLNHFDHLEQKLQLWSARTIYCKTSLRQLRTCVFGSSSHWLRLRVFEPNSAVLLLCELFRLPLIVF